MVAYPSFKKPVGRAHIVRNRAAWPTDSNAPLMQNGADEWGRPWASTTTGRRQACCLRMREVTARTVQTHEGRVDPSHLLPLLLGLGATGRLGAAVHRYSSQRVPHRTRREAHERGNGNEVLNTLGRRCAFIRS